MIGAEGKHLPGMLQNLDPTAIRKTSSNGDRIDLSTWDIGIDPLPLVGENNDLGTLPTLMLSPLALSVKGQKGRWHHDLTELGDDLSRAVNHRLSRLTQRNVKLVVKPDQLYLRANPRHSTLVTTRAVRGQKPAFVIGMLCPLILQGSIRDLCSAWSLGIGEKNRYGFGCIGAAGGRP